MPYPGSGVSSFEANPLFSSFSHQGINLGNPLLNMMVMMMAGQNYMPRPVNGQSIHESLIQRERTRQFMNLQRESFSNSMLFERMGIGGSGALGMAGMFASSPDSLLARGLSPLIGGNPMAASMQVYAGLSGANIMGAFGRLGGVDARETMDITRSLANKFYSRQSYEGPGGHREEIENNIRKSLLRQMDQGAAGANYLKDIGLANEGDIREGELTPKAREKIKNRLAYTAGKITPGEGQGDLGRKIEQAMLEKQFAAADMEKSLNEIEKSREDRNRIERVKTADLSEDRRETRSKALNKVNEQLHESDTQLRNQLQTVYGLPKKEIDALNKPGTNDIDAAKVRELIEKNRVMNTSLERNMLEAQRSRRADGRYTGFDFEKSRGFLLEDFTSGFVKAAEYRMLGGRARDKKSAGAAMGDFAENAGRALDAARAVFGDRSGGELMEKINEFMGTAKADLSTKTGAGDVENLLRNVTATARVAGLSIKTMLGIIDSAKQLASQSPQLQRANSAGLATMSTSVVRSAAGLGAMMSPEDYRQAGGNQGLAAEEMQSRMGYTGSEIAGFTAAIMLAGGPKVMDYFKKRGSMTAKDFNNGGIKEIARLMGRSEQDVMRIGYNEHFQQMGMKNRDVLETLAGQFGEETITRSFYDLAHNVGIREDEVREKYRKHIESGGTWDEFEAKTFADLPPQGQAMLTAHRATLRKQLLRSSMPVDQVRQLDIMSEDSQKIDKELSEKYSAFSAKPITQVINALMQSKTVAQASEAFASIFSTKGDSEDMKAARLQAKEATEELQQDLTGPNSNKESLIQQNKLAPQLNKLLALRNAEEGKTGSAAYGLAKGTTTADLQEMVETIKTAGFEDPIQATKKLKDLEELQSQGKKLSPRELQLKRALSNAKNLSFLDSEKAFKQIRTAAAGSELQAVGAASLTAYTEFKTTQQYNEQERETYRQSAKALDIAAKGKDLNAIEAKQIQETYGGGAEGFKKASEAFRRAQEGTEENIFTIKGSRERNKSFGYFGQLVETSRSQIEQIDAKRKGTDTSAPEEPMKQMTSAIDELMKMIKDGGGIKEAINSLVRSIADMNN